MNLYLNGPRNVFRLDATLAEEVAQRPLEPIPPSYGTTISSTPLVSEVTFADGYAQRMDTGLHSVQRKVSMRFDGRRLRVITALRRFFEGEGVGSIYYRTPAEYFFWAPFPPFGVGPEKDTNPAKWVISGDISITPVSADIASLSVNLVESFEP